MELPAGAPATATEAGWTATRCWPRTARSARSKTPSYPPGQAALVVDTGLGPLDGMSCVPAGVVEYINHHSKEITVHARIAVRRSLHGQRTSALQLDVGSHSALSARCVPDGNDHGIRQDEIAGESSIEPLTRQGTPDARQRGSRKKSATTQ